MSNSDEETCPFVITKGNRKGQVCSEKLRNKNSKYCRAHLRNIGVKIELGDIPRSKSIDDLSKLSKNVPRPVDNKYKPTVVENVTIKKIEPNKNRAFATAFAKEMDENLADDNAEVDMDEIYDRVDVADDVDEEDIPVDDEDPKVQYLKKQLESSRSETLKAQRKISSMFTMKQLLFIGVKKVSDVGEILGGEKMNGYSKTVMSSDSINALLDEMSDDLESMIGFSELPAHFRLLGTMGVIGASVYTNNTSGVTALEINPVNVPSKVSTDDPPTNNSQRFSPVAFAHTD
jgi:hypothetical protein